MVGPALQYLISAADTHFPLRRPPACLQHHRGVRTRIVERASVMPARLHTAPAKWTSMPHSQDFKISEHMKFQFRMDAFNVLNHTNFTAPNHFAFGHYCSGRTSALFNTSSAFGKDHRNAKSRTINYLAPLILIAALGHRKVQGVNKA